MIVYPKNWNRKYEELNSLYLNPCEEIGSALYLILKKINVFHIAYSGGIDSTIMLHMMSIAYYGKIHTYTIGSRENHPDIQFARKGSKIYNTTHHEFIVEPTYRSTDKFKGDNAVRQLFEMVSKFTNKIICCDGIDEFMCGYYDHQDKKVSTYRHYLSKLTPNHLAPLNKGSKDMEVYLPYLDNRLIDIYRKIPLVTKVDSEHRKKIIIEIAIRLGISDEFITRNKYGFCDAFIDKNK